MNGVSISHRDMCTSIECASFGHSFPSLDRTRFPILDIAFADGATKLTPLNIAMNIENGGYCGTLPSIVEGMYVPVLHKENWEDVKPRTLTRGEQVHLDAISRR